MSKKILVIRFGAIGDVVHTTIIHQSIKAKYPDYEFHFLTYDFIAPLLENDPNLAKVYSFDARKKDDLLYLLKLGLKLRKAEFDIIINLQTSLRSRFLNLIANPKRIIYRNKNRIHAVDAFFNSAKEIVDDIEKPKDLNLFISEEVNLSIENKIKNYPRPFIVINPGGENDVFRQGRIWSLQHWSELSNKLIKKYGGTIFIAGSKGEKDYHKKLSSLPSSVLFSGELKLDESAALFSQADLFISGDSGPLHMASALGINTLGLMGSTRAITCGPYASKGYAISPLYDCGIRCNKVCQISQESIYKPCIQSITPDVVFDFIQENKLLN